ncbi:MAG: UbiA family prenyltransferase [Cryomorphaceae bacterium]|nr:UbiA family prenyltransferase [Cryomorphaceae bacterium]
MQIWLKTLRWKNLLIAVVLLLAFRLGINGALSFPSALPNWAFVLAVLSSLLLMAGGYLVNDIYDREADRVNRPERGKIFTLYSVDFLYKVSLWLMGGGILIGGFLAIYIDKMLYIAFPMITALLLYQYASQLKKQALVGNLVISLLSGLIVISLLAFDVLPSLESDETIKENFQGMVYIYLIFASFSFFITFIRELLKDIEDIKGDRRAGYKTLPILWGERPVRFICFLLLLVFLVFFAQFTRMMLFERNTFWIFVLGIVILSGWVTWLIRPGARTVNYRLSQNILKGLMLYGILLLPVISMLS